VNAEAVDRLVTTLERKIGRSWVAMVEFLRKRNKLGAVEAAVRRGDVDGAVDGIVKAAARFADDVNAGFQIAQAAAARWLDGEVTDRLIRYDISNERAVAWMRSNRLQLGGGISQELRESIGDTIADGLRQGRNPLSIARDIRDGLGLTAHQRRIVRNYRKALETRDFSDALGRELRDGRYDRGILAAQRDGVPLPREKINAMVDRYRQRMIAHRAETIARTEALRAAHAGQHELFQSAVDGGDIKERQLVRRWLHRNRGKHNRDFHHVMNGQTRGLNEAFKSGLGNLLKYPGDRYAPARETVNCRCVVTTRYIRSPAARAGFEAGSALANLQARIETAVR
jgi:hypothetical protein